MKHSCNPATLFFCGWLLIAGCAKNDLSTSRSATVSTNATLPELNSCKIRRIYQEGATVSALFSYNRVGNPYSVLYSNGGTGVDNHYFYYDAQNRLTEWRLVWGDFPVHHHFYKYNTKNEIVKDSLINNNAGNGEVNSVYVSTIEYDGSGRVIKETIVNTYSRLGTFESTRRPTFTYDSRGNLAVTGWKSSSYDNKINPLRQNAVFQFIFRNYSMNNAAVQTRYNSLGLPLSINPANDAFFNALTTDKVVYDCQ